MISGLRRRSTPRRAGREEDAGEREVPGDVRPVHRLLRARVVERPRVRAEHDAADGGDEQHDRRDLEREQVVGEEEPPDRAGGRTSA